MRVKFDQYLMYQTPYKLFNLSYLIRPFSQAFKVDRIIFTLQRKQTLEFVNKFPKNMLLTNSGSRAGIQDTHLHYQLSY